MRPDEFLKYPSRTDCLICVSMCVFSWRSCRVRILHLHQMTLHRILNISKAFRGHESIPCPRQAAKYPDQSLTDPMVWEVRSLLTVKIAASETPHSMQTMHFSPQNGLVAGPRIAICVGAACQLACLHPLAAHLHCSWLPSWNQSGACV